MRVTAVLIKRVFGIDSLPLLSLSLSLSLSRSLSRSFALYVLNFENLPRECTLRMCA